MNKLQKNILCFRQINYGKTWFDFIGWEEKFYKERYAEYQKGQSKKTDALVKEGRASGVLQKCVAKAKELVPVQQKIQEIAEKRKYAGNNSAVLDRLGEQVDEQQEKIMNIRYAFDKLGCEKYKSAIQRELAH